MTESIPKERVRIFNRLGDELASFMVDVSRSWAIGREGRAQFTYPVIKTNVVNETVLQFGNYLLVENSKLPAWVGVIDTPRSWDSKSVTISAYTPERLFQYRRGSQSDEVISGSAGTIFLEMLRRINSKEKTILESGVIFTGGSRREETLNPNTMDINLRQLQERSLEEYSFRPIVKKNKLAIMCDWSKQLGIQTPLTLAQAKNGGNLGESTMREDEDIYNDIFGYGEGLTWDTKPKYTTRNADSVSKYGLREKGEGWRGVVNISTIIQNNTDMILETKQPKKIFQLVALNIGDTFKYLDMGNRIKILLEGIGFSQYGNNTLADTRILGMSYSPRQNKNSIRIVAKDV